MQNTTYRNHPANWKIKSEGKTYDLPEGLWDYVFNCVLPDQTLVGDTRVRNRLHVEFPSGNWMDIRLSGEKLITIVYSGKPMGFIRNLLSTEPDFFER